ncbi:MAG TPA: prolipoprotein diacylglyceryl transferase family protein [Kofleriaceae bacterium]|nr:prolipoprotein diacylglyceryl transferase family protein [Kofleriaceae bacterium]
MYAAALTLSGATTVATTGVPFFMLGSLGPIESFGLIVAAGVLIGAALLRRYAEWHGVEDDHIRGLTGWITITGFLGAHVFDVLAYQWKDLLKDPLLILKVWHGISSYGGFIGGAMGFALYVWWKRLPVRLMADIALVGLMPAFSIGRIGCTVVSDHVGAALKDPNAWYAFLAMDYPRSAATNSNIAHLFQQHPDARDSILAWNLGLVEFFYLVPVNAVILWLAFRSAKRVPAGFIAVLTGILYAPVRFFLDYLRPENSDPRHFGLTFAQWASILAFGVSVYVAGRVLKNGTPAKTIAKTSSEAQAKLRVVLKEVEEEEKAEKASKGKSPAAKPKTVEAAKPAEVEDAEDAALAKEAEEAGRAERAAEKAADEGAEKAAEKAADEAADETAEKAAAANVEEPADEGAEVDPKAAAEAAKPASKPAQSKQSKQGGGGGKGKGKKR